MTYTASVRSLAYRLDFARSERTTDAVQARIWRGTAMWKGLNVGGNSGSAFPTIIMFALLFGLMYFMFIRPQAKRRKEAESMQKSLGAGDKVITIGGLYGTVVSTDDESVTLEIAPGVTARYARQAVGRVTEQVKAPTEHVVDNPVKEDK